MLEMHKVNGRGKPLRKVKMKRVLRSRKEYHLLRNEITSSKINASSDSENFTYTGPFQGPVIGSSNEFTYF